MTFSLATWNINSVRLRAPLIEQLIGSHSPDILCLQEIKCSNDDFPSKFFHDHGYTHQAVHGQKGYHGVAILSRLPFSETSKRDFCGKGDARHVSVMLEGTLGQTEPVHVHNFYVPAGGDEPNPDVNEKFAHKLAFLKEMTGWFSDQKADGEKPMILVGDLNIAPLENDVWSHKQLLRVVSHTPVEVEHLAEVQTSHDWIDAIRTEIPEETKLFTWWSYRAKDWRAADRGRRLDHIWVTPQLAENYRGIEVIKDARGWEKPSDHVPIVAQFTG